MYVGPVNVDVTYPNTHLMFLIQAPKNDVCMYLPCMHCMDVNLLSMHVYIVHIYNMWEILT